MHLTKTVTHMVVLCNEPLSLTVGAILGSKTIQANAPLVAMLMAVIMETVQN